MRSIHPYKTYIPDNTTKLIIGSIPPYRFCNKKERLNKKDVGFYYGSYKNQFWHLLEEATNIKLDYENTEKAVIQRKALLKSYNIGITDVVKSCIHKDGKSDDKSLIDIEYRKIDKLLKKYKKIDTLICTSSFVVTKLNMFASKKYRASINNKRIGTIIINNKEYKVIILYSPSPYALMGLGIDGISKRKAQYISVFKNDI